MAEHPDERYALDFLDFLLREDKEVERDYKTFIAGFKAGVDALVDEEVPESHEEIAETIGKSYLDWRKDRGTNVGDDSVMDKDCGVCGNDAEFKLDSESHNGESYRCLPCLIDPLIVCQDDLGYEGLEVTLIRSGETTTIDTGGEFQ